MHVAGAVGLLLRNKEWRLALGLFELLHDPGLEINSALVNQSRCSPENSSSRFGTYHRRI